MNHTSPQAVNEMLDRWAAMSTAELVQHFNHDSLATGAACAAIAGGNYCLKRRGHYGNHESAGLLWGNAGG